MQKATLRNRNEAQDSSFALSNAATTKYSRKSVVSPWQRPPDMSTRFLGGHLRRLSSGEGFLRPSSLVPNGSAQTKVYGTTSRLAQNPSFSGRKRYGNDKVNGDTFPQQCSSAANASRLTNRTPRHSQTGGNLHRCSAQFLHSRK